MESLSPPGWPLYLERVSGDRKPLPFDCCLLICVKRVDGIHSVSSGHVYGSHLASLLVAPEK